MSNLTLSLVISGAAGILFMIIEMVLTFGLDFIDTPEVKKWVRAICKGIIWVCTVIWTGIFFLCCFVALDLFQQGQNQEAVKLLISALIIVVGIYVLFIRHYMKKLKGKK